MSIARPSLLNTVACSCPRISLDVRHSSAEQQLSPTWQFSYYRAACAVAAPGHDVPKVACLCGPAEKCWGRARAKLVFASHCGPVVHMTVFFNRFRVVVLPACFYSSNVISVFFNTGICVIVLIVFFSVLFRTLAVALCCNLQLPSW